MDEPYEGREQSAAKHLILAGYLEKLAYKVGLRRSGLTINYIDGFAGPWESKTEDLSDTSPGLALKQLLAVKEDLRTHHGVEIEVRAFFVTRTGRGETQLEALRARFAAAEIVIKQGRFEQVLADAQAFADHGSDRFTFIFIDHTGWSGFGLNEITPLLRKPNSEVLINFMMEHIKRFVDDQGSSYERSFQALFGDAAASYRDAWRGLSGQDREDRIVETYCERIAAAGNYRHCVSSIVLMPRADRTFFHLVYGTRSDEGLVTFREIERVVMRFQREGRTLIHQRAQESRTRQPLLFEAPAITSRTHEDKLHERHRAIAARKLDELLRRSEEVSWDELVMTALQSPTICEATVKQWLKERQQAKQVEVLGLSPRARVPQRNAGHRVRVVK